MWKEVKRLIMERFHAYFNDQNEEIRYYDYFGNRLEAGDTVVYTNTSPIVSINITSELKQYDGILLFEDGDEMHKLTPETNSPYLAKAVKCRKQNNINIGTEVMGEVKEGLDE